MCCWACTIHTECSNVLLAMAKAKKCRGKAARIKKERLERPQSQHPSLYAPKTAAPSTSTAPNTSMSSPFCLRSGSNPQPLDCSLHPDRCVLHLRQYILHPVYILYNPGGLRVWGWDLRHSGGAPVRVVSVVSRPGGAPPEPMAAKPPQPGYLFAEIRSMAVA